MGQPKYIFPLVNWTLFWKNLLVKTLIILSFVAVFSLLAIKLKTSFLDSLNYFL